MVSDRSPLAISLGLNLAVALFFIGIIAFIFNGGDNLLMMIIALELILLAVGLLFVHLTFHLDDLVGSTLTLYILPLAGAESAVALALQVAYYPLRGTILLTHSPLSQ